MPGRLTPLVDNQIYHIFNLGIDHCPTFTDMSEYKRAITVLDFYRFANPPMKLSKFLKLSSNERDRISVAIKDANEKLVEIFVYCLMPNHFHFLLRQLRENGISKFLGNFQNSYTRYFNTKKERLGSLFLDQFKAVIIETDEQLVHVSRYIHLNPLTSFVVKDFKGLFSYPWSSFKEYIEGKNEVCEINTVLNFFKTPKDYVEFVHDQVDYQRELHKIKHLLLE